MPPVDNDGRAVYAVKKNGDKRKTVKRSALHTRGQTEEVRLTLDDEGAYCLQNSRLLLGSAGTVCGHMSPRRSYLQYHWLAGVWRHMTCAQGLFRISGGVERTGGCARGELPCAAREGGVRPPDVTY